MPQLEDLPVLCRVKNFVLASREGLVYLASLNGQMAHISSGKAGALSASIEVREQDHLLPLGSSVNRWRTNEVKVPSPLDYNEERFVV